MKSYNSPQRRYSVAIAVIITLSVAVLTVLLWNSGSPQENSGEREVASGQSFVTTEDQLPGLWMEYGSKERLGFHDDQQLQMGQVVTTSGRAFVEASGDINVYDLSQAFPPQFLGRIRREGKLLRLIGASGNYVYLSEGSLPGTDLELGRYRVTHERLLIYDVSTPSSAQLSASLQLAAGATDTYYVGNRIAYCYSTTAGGGLNIIDVSQPTAPTALGGVALRIPEQVVFDSTYAYVADKDSQGNAIVSVIDISSPSAMHIVNSLTIGMMPTEMGVSEQRILLMEDVIHILDLTNAPTLTELSQVELPRRPSVVPAGMPDFVTPEAPRRMEPIAFVANGNALYISTSRSITAETSSEIGVPDFIDQPVVIGVSLVDVNHPVVTGMTDRSSNVVSLAVSGDALLLSQEDGLHVLSIDSMGHVEEASGTNHTRGWVRSVAVGDNFAVAADNYAGLRVINLANPTNINETAIVSELAGKAGIVEVQGNYAFVVSDTGVLSVVDVSDLNAPDLISQQSITAALGFDTFPRDMVSIPSWLYIADGTGVTLVKIADPASPSVVTHFGDFGRYLDIDTTNNVLVVAEADGRAALYDISAPASPILGTLLDVPLKIGAVAISSGYAYLPGILGGLSVVDLSAGAAGAGIATSITSATKKPLAAIAAGNRVYVGSQYSDLWIFNISSSNSPTLVNGSAPETSKAFDLDIFGGYVLGAAGDSCIVIDVTDPDHPAKVSSITFPG